MDQRQSITQVSREYGVSARMLRYYEGLGLLKSERREGYAYRVYSGEETARLRQILILRKLRVSLKEIKAIFEDPSAVTAISVLEKHLEKLNREAGAMDDLRNILRELVTELKKRAWLPAGETILRDEGLLALTNSLSSSNLIQKERKMTMQDLNDMEREANGLRDVRIVYLPATAVASAHFVGDDPENKVGVMIADFCRENRLWEKHPGLRLYGFNHPNPVDETGYHGYEFWVTIPDDMEVAPPLQKKYFPGGTYAAHMIQMGNFHEWAWLDKWVQENGEYEYNGAGDPEVMYSALEEHLNFHEHIRQTPSGEANVSQLDLLIPVRKK